MVVKGYVVELKQTFFQDVELKHEIGTLEIGFIMN